jgi:glycosyltransferase domain-containing protein
VKRLTFVLPLKDRPNYTSIWLAHNIRQEYDYLIADGSVGNENEELFREIELPNVTYVRFPQDLSIEHYVEKMFQAVGQVRTAYVMTCDNDDFINFPGVASCIDALEKDPDAVCSGGPIYGVNQVASAAPAPRYGMPVRIVDAAAFSGMSGFDALVQLFKSYKYMWYSVFRTKSYQRIWSDIRQLQISNVYLVEILQAELAFCHGQYVQVPANHYIRLENPVTSAARETASMDERHTRKIFFDNEYREQVIRMSAHVAKLADVALSQLLHEFANYFIAGNSKNMNSFGSRMSIRLARLHEIIPRRLGLSFPIEFGIGFVNGLGKVRSRLGI